MADEKKLLTPKEIASKTQEIWATYFMGSDIPKTGEELRNEVASLIREYGEQQRQQGRIEAFQCCADWATYNIDMLKDKNEDLVV